MFLLFANLVFYFRNPNERYMFITHSNSILNPDWSEISWFLLRETNQIKSFVLWWENKSIDGCSKKVKGRSLRYKAEISKVYKRDDFDPGLNYLCERKILIQTKNKKFESIQIRLNNFMIHRWTVFWFAMILDAMTFKVLISISQCENDQFLMDS